MSVTTSYSCPPCCVVTSPGCGGVVPLPAQWQLIVPPNITYSGSPYTGFNVTPAFRGCIDPSGTHILSLFPPNPVTPLAGPPGRTGDVNSWGYHCYYTSAQLNTCHGITGGLVTIDNIEPVWQLGLNTFHLSYGDYVQAELWLAAHPGNPVFDNYCGGVIREIYPGSVFPNGIVSFPSLGPIVFTMRGAQAGSPYYVTGTFNASFTLTLTAV